MEVCVLSCTLFCMMEYWLQKLVFCFPFKHLITTNANMTLCLVSYWWNAEQKGNGVSYSNRLPIAWPILRWLQDWPYSWQHNSRSGGVGAILTVALPLFMQAIVYLFFLLMHAVLSSIPNGSQHYTAVFLQRTSHQRHERAASPVQEQCSAPTTFWSPSRSPNYESKHCLGNG